MGLSLWKQNILTNQAAGDLVRVLPTTPPPGNLFLVQTCVAEMRLR